ncbi:hypothetical protein EIN_252630 [Entamoeba invadens IP1]|uniref:Uncharacterized protein n=1 Tax=Entamoeba invadens IP1 TaxID=370355 RepID=A0A0A1UGP3_ENTIV|nr:hypothetical protein EIN_252630 [Entamoeba invadens IP1]ELP95029.1 hypothetical protein EIN_252630 [Entamoeba invadens IP1]|eukprot:XP_004261800.1 hypothetical protein EIN_252630 [Entamoeba invadens IP1]
MSLLSPQNVPLKLSGIMSKVKPLGDMILVQGYNTSSIGGIVLAEQKDEKFKQGVVVATDKTNLKNPLKVGNHIVFGGTPAATFLADNKKYSLLKYHDVFAKIE